MMIQPHPIWSHTTFATEVSKVQQDFAEDRQPRSSIGIVTNSFYITYTFQKKLKTHLGFEMCGFLLNELPDY